jgi:hypothetical protein
MGAGTAPVPAKSSARDGDSRAVPCLPSRRLPTIVGAGVEVRTSSRSLRPRLDCAKELRP